MGVESPRLGRIAASIGVTDMARAVDFYTRAFGLEIGFQNGSPVQFTLLELGEAELHLLLAPGWRGPPFNVAHLITTDVDALHRRCTEAGVKVVRALADKDYGTRASVIEDPDGNRIDIGQPD